jgi:hypothetical protein
MIEEDRDGTQMKIGKNENGRDVLKVSRNCDCFLSEVELNPKLERTFDLSEVGN